MESDVILQYIPQEPITEVVQKICKTEALCDWIYAIPSFWLQTTATRKMYGL